MTRRFEGPTALLLTLALAAPAAAAPATRPPATRTAATASTYFGVRVPDPYRWLEAAGTPAVQHWIAAQNAWTEQVLGSFPEGGPIAAAVKKLSLTSTQRRAPEIVDGKLFYLQQTPPQPQAELVAGRWPRGKQHVLVNPNTTSGVALTGYWPSPDGRYVAYGTAEGGSEATTIHVVETANGKILDDALPRAGGGTTPQALVWDADGKGFTYVRLPLPGSAPDSELQFHAALYHHVLGKPAADDTLEFGKGLSPVAEYTLLGSAHGDAAALVHFGDGNPDYVYVRTRGGDWHKVLGPAANIRAASGVNGGAAWMGRRLLLVSYRDAPRGKLIAVRPNGKSTPLVPQGDWAMHAVTPIRGGFLLTRVSGPDWRVDQYTAAGKFVRTVPLPSSGIGIGSIAASSRSREALITYSGWTIPGRWIRYDAANGKAEIVFDVKPAADYSGVRTYRLEADSKDGTKIPVTVIAMDGVKPDRPRPAILYGYGGFGIAVAPRFLGANLAWLKRGGIYAVANIRGGGEYGEGWHEAGMLAKKQNVFDDFYAAAQALVQHGWTDTAHLGILGGSNGGLLMAAELTQHPKEFRAVVSFVGIYDMLRAERWPNGRYNVSEYGTVTKKPDFQWLYAYSPLQNVKPGTAYPAVLLETGVNDPRVAPWQSRKFAAALQAATSSKRPVLLLTRMNEGHGVTASFSQRVGNTAAALTFFAHELDLKTGQQDPPQP